MIYQSQPAFCLNPRAAGRRNWERVCSRTQSTGFASVKGLSHTPTDSQNREGKMSWRSKWDSWLLLACVGACGEREIGSCWTFLSPHFPSLDFSGVCATQVKIKSMIKKWVLVHPLILSWKALSGKRTMLKDKIQLSKSENVISVIKGLMNQDISHLINRSSEELCKMQGFYRQKGAGIKEWITSSFFGGIEEGLCGRLPHVCWRENCRLTCQDNVPGGGQNCNWVKDWALVRYVAQHKGPHFRPVIFLFNITFQVVLFPQHKTTCDAPTTTWLWGVSIKRKVVMLSFLKPLHVLRLCS